MTMKSGRFHKVHFTMTSLGRGQYRIEAEYKGRYVETQSTDSEAYDFLDDESDMERHKDALRHCYNKIREEYESHK